MVRRQGGFEIYNPFALDRLRIIRNSLTHPLFYGFGGPAYNHIIYSCVDLINDLYENIELRRERMSQIRDLNTRLALLCSSGATLGNKTILHTARVRFYNNKITPSTISLVFVKPFMISEDQNTLLENPFITYECSSHESTDGENLVFRDLKGTSVEISPIRDAKQRAIFEDWLTCYKSKESNIAYDFMINQEIGEYYGRAKNEFHRNA